MKKTYFIFHHRQIGNVGAWELPKIKNQPEEGFSTEIDAIQWMTNKFKEKKEYGFRENDRPYWNQYIILPIYTKN